MFCCSLCNFKAQSSANVARHIVVKHRGMQWKCNIVTNESGQKEGYKMKISHNNNFPMESHAGWIMDKRANRKRVESVTESQREGDYLSTECSRLEEVRSETVGEDHNYLLSQAVSPVKSCLKCCFKLKNRMLKRHIKTC